MTTSTVGGQDHGTDSPATKTSDIHERISNISEYITAEYEQINMLEAEPCGEEARQGSITATSEPESNSDRLL